MGERKDRRMIPVLMVGAFLGSLSQNMLTSALPAILLKSCLLAAVAGLAARRYGRVSLPLMLGVVLAYQVLGTLGEWAMKGDFYLAAQDFRIGIPGMLLQVVGGYLFIKYLIRK